MAAVIIANSLYLATRFANFEGILGFSVPSIILADLDPLCLFLCFKVSLIVIALSRTILGNDRLVFVEAFYDLSYYCLLQE